MALRTIGWLGLSAGLVVAGLTLAAEAPVKRTEEAPQPALPSYQTLYRVPIPKTLPEHPRVFCTAADLARIRRDLAAGDAYTRACVDRLRALAQDGLERPIPSGKPTSGDLTVAAVLAQAYAITGEEAYGKHARDLLLAAAAVYPKLTTTRASGRLTESTLAEGPLAVNAAMAYDLIATAPFLSAAERRRIEQDFLRVMAWECGHNCHHPNSSNWRTWALAIVASCGFAIGDPALIEEAVNGVWDPGRQQYLYGAVQTLTHSIFSDGIHWERSMGYTYYTASALMYVLVPAKNAGIDLWHAKLPGILGPFQGVARHEEFGPAGDRSVRAFLDAPFFYAFSDGSFACVGDSATRTLAYHPIYELAYREYQDPRYAWLIRRQRDGRADGAPAGWSLWTPSGNPECGLVPEQGRPDGNAFRFRCAKGDRAALVQNFTAPANEPVRVSGWVKAPRLEGGSAHLRCNIGEEAFSTPAVQEAGDWQEVSVEIPARANAQPGDRRSIRLHVFLEGGAGEVLWSGIRATAKDDATNLVQNGGFSPGTADGRDLSFWALVHSVKEVPEGRYRLDEDAAIGVSGRHENGCSLFPVGGFAVLRQNAADPMAPAVNLAYGPYGSGHDHPDRLHFDLYGRGEILCPDAGSWGYDNPMHVTWANQTIAHNTLTVDEVSQEPQGTSTGVFQAEKGDQRVFGVLRLFHPGTRAKVVRATCDTAYEGVTMDRTLCVVGPYVLDLFRARSDQEHTYDLALHGPGEVRSEASLALVKGPLAARGYNHLTQVRQGQPPAGTFRADFRREKNALLLLQAHPAGGEILLARDPARGAATSACIARRRGREAVYVTVLEPYADAPTVRALSTTQEGDRLTVVVEHANGTDTFSLADAVDGPVVIRRTGADGQPIFEENARP